MAWDKNKKPLKIKRKNTGRKILNFLISPLNSHIGLAYFHLKIPI
jgi:hypothetical protein